MADRRPRPPEAVSPKPEHPPVRIVWWRLAVVAVLVALVVAAGLGMSYATQLKPVKALTSCHTSTQLGPRLYRAAPPMCIDLSRQYTATLNTTRGAVTLQLLPRSAPITVNNFVVLAINGFYDGLPFWRAETWVVQSGDPNGDGHGGPGYILPDDQKPDETDWAPGTVGMARAQGGEINGSQFFLVRGQWPQAGPGSVVYNHFANVDGASQSVIQQLTSADRILNVAISVQCPPSLVAATPSAGKSPDC